MKKVIDYATPFIVWYLLWVIISFSFVIGYNYFMPMNNWIEYQSVEPLKKINKIGDLFRMVSTRDFTRDSDVEWFDILICNNEWIPWRYSAMKSEWKINKSLMKTTSRRYIADTPVDPSECYMVSHITLKLILWLQKEQVVTSTWFSFVH